MKKDYQVLGIRFKLEIYTVEIKNLIVLTYQRKDWIVGRFGWWGFCFVFERARE